MTHEDNGDAKMGSYVLYMSLCNGLLRTLMHGSIVYLNPWPEAGCLQVATSGPLVVISSNRQLGRRQGFKAEPRWL